MCHCIEVHYVHAVCMVCGVVLAWLFALNLCVVGPSFSSSIVCVIVLSWCCHWIFWASLVYVCSCRCCFIILLLQCGVGIQGPSSLHVSVLLYCNTSGGLYWAVISCFLVGSCCIMDMGGSFLIVVGCHCTWKLFSIPTLFLKFFCLYLCVWCGGC